MAPEAGRPRRRDAGTDDGAGIDDEVGRGDAPTTGAEARPARVTSAERRRRLLETVARLPEGPGCYLFRDVTGKVAYVGKARRLRDRVKSYFNERSGDHRRRCASWTATSTPSSS